MTLDNLREIRKTKDQYLVIALGEYLLTGFFWVFASLGSLWLIEDEKGEAKLWNVALLFFSMFVLMLSNGFWEVLTGWYADKSRRRLSLSGGFISCLTGFFLMGIAPTVKAADSMSSARSLIWSTGIAIWSLGPALLSGAQEAWLVDRCNFFSPAPPEDLKEIFKLTAARGMILKSLGAIFCFLLMLWSRKAHEQAFIIAGLTGLTISLVPLAYSLRLREEYWSHPKYQTKESLFAFLRSGLKELWKVPYSWFTVGYIGAMSLNYVVSATVWPYLVATAKDSPLPWLNDSDGRLFFLAMVLLAAELLGGFLSRPFTKCIDHIGNAQLRIPVASLICFAPMPFLWAVAGRQAFLLVLICAAFLYRAVNASTLGSLNNVGQLAIKSDERRALLFSLSSSISSFLMAIVFFGFFVSTYKVPSDVTHLAREIENFWRFVPLTWIALLALGGYFATRPRAITK